MIEALQYKLGLFLVPVDGAADVFCDKNSVVKSSSIPKSVLNKSHNTICYHQVMEYHDAGVLCVGYIPG